MSLLQDEDRKQVQQLFAGLSNPVKLVMFTQEFECRFCTQTRELVEEVASLSDTITSEVYNLTLDKGKSKEYGIEQIPAVAVVGDEDYGIRFYGIPSGYEFSSLLESIMNVSAKDSGLSEATSAFLSGLKDPLHIQVFVTPT